MGRIDSVNDIIETLNNQILNKMDVCFCLTSKCGTLGQIRTRSSQGSRILAAQRTAICQGVALILMAMTGSGGCSRQWEGSQESPLLCLLNLFDLYSVRWLHIVVKKLDNEVFALAGHVSSKIQVFFIHQEGEEKDIGGANGNLIP